MLGMKPTGLPAPIITWTGTTSGSQALLSSPNVPFATVGTYTFTVNRTCMFDLEAVGAGWAGGDGTYNNFVAPDGAGGGGGGADGTASYTFIPNVTYEIRVPDRSSGLSAFIKVQSGAMIIEMGSANGVNGGTVGTGSGRNGGNAGAGGIGESVAPRGEGGTTNGGTGGGGGGGTCGSLELGGGGDGGGMSNGTANHGSPPGQGDTGGDGAAVTCAGISAGFGGGGGWSANDPGPNGGPGRVGGQGAVEMNFTG